MLTADEQTFLRSQGLSADDVYDARGQSTSQWRFGVRAAGLVLVLGTPCGKAGHRLRTRSGHCFQCDTSKISYQSRHNSVGYVYIAGSRSEQLIKIGFAVDIPQRERNLRHQSYAGISDWTMLFSAQVETGGKVEGAVQSDLQQYAEARTYLKDGHEQQAKEVFRTTFTTAINAMLRQLEQVPFKSPWHSLDWQQYDGKAVGRKGSRSLTR